MTGLDTKDFILLAGAAYLAISSLVRLMRQRHTELIGQVRQQLEQEQRRKRSGKA